MWEEFITQNFHISRVSGKGWHMTKCQMCSDKKIRAGFTFSVDHWGYNCFNCNFKIKYEYNNAFASKDIVDALFSRNGLIISDWEHLVVSDHNDEHATIIAPKKQELYDPNEVELPLGAKNLVDCPKNARLVRALQWLVKKGMNPTKQPFFITTQHPIGKEQDFRDRLILPFYFKQKLIFYQGAWIGASYNDMKYMSLANDRSNVFYNMDELLRETTLPLLVTEGLTDAHHFNGVAVLSNVITDQQIHWLKHCKRQKIILPDHDVAGVKMIKTAIAHNWAVSFPNWGDHINDVDESVRHYGKVRTAKLIMDGICTSHDEIIVKSSIYCINK